MRNKKQPEPATFESAWASIQKTAREGEKVWKSIKAMQKEIGGMKTAREGEKVWKSIKAMQKEIGGISNSNGEVAEAYFINSFKKYPHLAGQDFQVVDSNVRRYLKSLNLKDEYDLMLYNGIAVAIVEIKYKAKREDVETLLKKAENFKILFPQYKDYALYLGLAGLHVNITAEREAIKQGVAVIKQVGENMVVNDAHLKVF